MSEMPLGGRVRLFEGTWVVFASFEEQFGNGGSGEVKGAP